MKDKKMSISVYLPVLAVSDIVTLFSEALPGDILNSKVWLNITIQDMHISGCWVISYILLCASETSSWCLVCITVERLVAIVKPL